MVIDERFIPLPRVPFTLLAKKTGDNDNTWL
jgi:hypothetical protein